MSLWIFEGEAKQGLKYTIITHPLSPISKRGLYAVLAVVVVMAIGTIGTKLLTGWAWIDSFYFMSMVATAEGPPNAPPNFWSKVFISVMAFVSIGTLISSIGILFGPFLGYAFHKGAHFAEELEAKNKDH
jgi:Gpi18-like mannosyltransferase